MADKDNESLPIKPGRRQGLGWLWWLVSTSQTVIIPTMNALGYSQVKREAAGVDPNCNLPFDIEPADSNNCLWTIARQGINKLFRSHLFHLGLMFYGGMEVVAYKWGFPMYLGRSAMLHWHTCTMPMALQDTHCTTTGPWTTRCTTSGGGVEDWAFAGSWDPVRVVKCMPRTFGGYPPKKTRYNFLYWYKDGNRGEDRLNVFYWTTRNSVLAYDHRLMTLQKMQMWGWSPDIQGLKKWIILCYNRRVSILQISIFASVQKFSALWRKDKARSMKTQRPLHPFKVPLLLLFQFCMPHWPSWMTPLFLTNQNPHIWQNSHGTPKSCYCRPVENKEEIKNLNGFECMYLSNLKVPYF